MPSQRIRTQQIIIDIPDAAAEPWFTMVVQRVYADDAGNVTQVVSRERQFNRRFSNVITETVNISDPVTGYVGPASVAGAGQLITLLVSQWLLEEYPDAVMEPGGHIVDGG